jgi:hypothetical protein
MGREVVSDSTVIFNQLTGLKARKYFINFSRYERFRSSISWS